MLLAIPLLALLWLAAIVAAPLLPPLVSAVVYAAGSLVCHQIPERSFHLGGSQLAVCARCVGIYAGAAGGAVAALALRLPIHAPTRTVRWIRPILAVAVLPTVVTVVLEMLRLWFPTNELRALAGVPFGVAIAFVVTAFAKVHYDSCAPRRRTAPSPPPPPI